VIPPPLPDLRIRAARSHPFSLTAHRKRPPRPLRRPRVCRQRGRSSRHCTRPLARRTSSGDYWQRAGTLAGAPVVGRLDRLLRARQPPGAERAARGARSLPTLRRSLSPRASGSNECVWSARGPALLLERPAALSGVPTSCSQWSMTTCLLLDEDYAAAGACHVASASPVSSARFSDDCVCLYSYAAAPCVGNWPDHRRLQCAAALQQWPRVRRLVTGLVAQQGVPLTDAGPPGNDDADEDGADEGVAAAEQSLRDLSLLEGRCGELDGRRRALVQRVCVDLSLTLLQQQQLQQQGARVGPPSSSPCETSFGAFSWRQRPGARAPAAAVQALGDSVTSGNTMGPGVSFRATAQARHVSGIRTRSPARAPRASAAIAKGIAAVPLVFTSLPALAVPCPPALPSGSCRPLAELRQYRRECASAASAHLLTSAWVT